MLGMRTKGGMNALSDPYMTLTKRESTSRFMVSFALNNNKYNVKTTVEDIVSQILCFSRKAIFKNSIYFELIFIRCLLI